MHLPNDGVGVDIVGVVVSVVVCLVDGAFVGAVVVVGHVVIDVDFEQYGRPLHDVHNDGSVVIGLTVDEADVTESVTSIQAVRHDDEVEVSVDCFDDNRRLSIATASSVSVPQ